MCLCEVVSLPPKKRRPQSEADDIVPPSATPIGSSREQLSNSVVEIYEMQRRVQEVSGVCALADLLSMRRWEWCGWTRRRVGGPLL